MSITSKNTKYFLLFFSIILIFFTLSNCDSSSHKESLSDLSNNSFSSNEIRDSITIHIDNIRSFASEYYKVSAENNGGENSFTGFSIPESLAKTDFAIYTDSLLTPNRVFISAIGKHKGHNNIDPIKMVFTITPDSLVAMAVLN